LGDGACPGFFYGHADRLRETERSGGGKSKRSFLDPTLQWFSELSIEKALCWALGKAPSELDNLFWKYSYADVRVILELKLGWEQTKASQEFNTIATVVGSIFGGSKDEEVEPEKKFDQVYRPQNSSEAVAALDAVLGKRR